LKQTLVYLLGDFSSQMPKLAQSSGPEMRLRLVTFSAMAKAYHPCSSQLGQLSQKIQLMAWRN
jgi:hypothetical protein